MHRPDDNQQTPIDTLRIVEWFVAISFVAAVIGFLVILYANHLPALVMLIALVAIVLGMDYALGLV